MSEAWVVRGMVRGGQVVRFAVVKDKAEADAIAARWEGTTSIDPETDENRGLVTAEVKHQKILGDWSPGQ